MANFGIRYAALIGVVMMLFVTFVACGTQLYQVSLHGDTESPNGSVMASSADGGGDPSSPTFGLHAPDGWGSALPIHFRVDYRLAPDQLQGLMRAMSTWETAVGRKLFTYEGIHQGVTGDSFKDLYSSLDDNINGYYLDDNWAKTGKPTAVLATTIWDNDPSNVKRIVTADIRFNNNYYVFGDSLVIKPVDGREVVDIQTLATHELGHMLGLAHISPSIDPQSIMVAQLYIGQGLSNRHVSKGDLQRIQKIYGCQGESCDLEKTLAKIDAAVEEPSSGSSNPTVVEVSH